MDDETGMVPVPLKCWSHYHAGIVRPTDERIPRKDSSLLTDPWKQEAGHTAQGHMGKCQVSQQAEGAGTLWAEPGLWSHRRKR